MCVLACMLAHQCCMLGPLQVEGGQLHAGAAHAMLAQTTGAMRASPHLPACISLPVGRRLQLGVPGACLHQPMTRSHLLTRPQSLLQAVHARMCHRHGWRYAAGSIKAVLIARFVLNC